MSGYSGTPLVKKLGIKEGYKLFIKNSPVDYALLLGGLPDQCELKSRLSKELDFVHLFTKSKKELSEFLIKAKQSIKKDGTIWVSWPKKASRIQTDVTEDVIREVCLPMELVDIKVSAVDEIWSGLKLVIRKEKDEIAS